MEDTDLIYRLLMISIPEWLYLRGDKKQVKRTLNKYNNNYIRSITVAKSQQQTPNNTTDSNKTNRQHELTNAVNDILLINLVNFYIQSVAYMKISDEKNFAYCFETHICSQQLYVPSGSNILWSFATI